MMALQNGGPGARKIRGPLIYVSKQSDLKKIYYFRGHRHGAIIKKYSNILFRGAIF